MAITIQEINELRKKTQAGLMDCKKALTEANGDMEAAMEILRKKGQLVCSRGLRTCKGRWQLRCYDCTEVRD